MSELIAPSILDYLLFPLQLVVAFACLFAPFCIVLFIGIKIDEWLQQKLLNASKDVRYYLATCFNWYLMIVLALLMYGYTIQILRYIFN